MSDYDFEMIEAAAQLIRAHLDNGLPVADECEWRGWSDSAELMRELIDEVSWTDLVSVLDAAARRLDAQSDTP
jgi:hypothetical protein